MARIHGLSRTSAGASYIHLLREARDRSRVKLLDFGIAKFLDRNDDRITSTGEFLGTPLYMAPSSRRL